MCVCGGGVVFTFCLRLNRNALPEKVTNASRYAAWSRCLLTCFVRFISSAAVNKLLKILWLRAMVGSWHHVSGVAQSVILVSAQLYSLVKLSGGQRSASSFVVHRHCALQSRSLPVLRASSAVSFSLSLLPHICALTLILRPFSPAAIWPST